MADKQFEQAAVANAKALWLDPSSTTARGNLLATINNWAIAAGGKQRFADAVDLLHRGLTLDPKYPTFAPNFVHVHHQWVEHLCGAGKFEEALEVLRRAATVLPDRPYFHRASMDVYRRWAGSLFEPQTGEIELNRKLWFTGLPARCRIQVFNLVGDLVKTLNHDDPVDGKHAWDILSEPVRAIASGLYIYVVEDLDTGDIQRGKLVIIK